MKSIARFRIVLLVLLVTLCFTSATVAGTGVKVMTYNVDEGTDFGPIIAALENQGNLQDAVGQTIDEVVASNPVLRMQLVAQEIASAQPDVVGLQEAAVWTFPTGTGTETVDFLQLIQADLVGLGQSYTPVETVDEFHIDLALPSGTVSFTDRDVILVRSDLASAITNHGQEHYSALVPLPAFPPYLPAPTNLTRGWAYADVPLNGTTFRFITTHLEDGTNTLSPIFLLAQALQEIELVSSAQAAATLLPVIIGGDFNTVANDPTSPTYLTYLFMLGNGFTDAWSAAGHGRGLTCCQEDLTIRRSELTQRIDQIFTRNGVSVSGTQLVGNHLVVTPYGSSWPSDHGAVESQLQVGSLP